MRETKKILPSVFLLALYLLLGVKAYAQVIVSSPALPNDEEPVTITFYADQGTAGLKDYAGAIYAHTGVITNKSSSNSDWRFVKAEWNVNLPECQLTKIADNTFQLFIPASIRKFYDVAEDESVLKLAFVFRSEDGSLEGKDTGGEDIFIDVFSSTLGISFSEPDGRWLIIEPDSNVTFIVNTNLNANITLALPDTSLEVSDSTLLSYSYSFESIGSYLIQTSAILEEDTVSDSLFVLVKSPVIEEQMNSEIKKGVTNLDNGSIGFLLEAPGKQSVYLIGDFNSWQPSNDYQLKKDGDYWWLIIDGLLPNTEYAYQYIVDGNLIVADPYSKKILDPWNDNYIDNATYPNLKEYPENKTDGIVSAFNTTEEQFQWQSADFVPESTENLVIYELLIRDFVENHTIKEVQEKLDYLQELGVNAIELMPFNEFEGNSSWGYNPSYYFATDKYYGTDADYKTFIDECHKRGIAVFMDIVFNHAFRQCPLVLLYYDGAKDQPTPDNPWFNVVSPNNVFYWGYDFDHSSEYTIEFVSDVVRYWLTEFKLDGFRFDFTKGFTNTYGDGHTYDASRIEILKTYYDTIKAINENALLICEHLSDNSEETELADYGILLWGNMNYASNELTMGYYRKADLNWASYKQRGWQQPNLIAYMESHDEERLMYKNLNYGYAVDDYDTRDESTALDRMKLATALFFSIPGPKMIWQFGEFGYDYSIDYNERVGEKPLHWEYLEDSNRKELFNVYASMIKLKNEYPVFGTSDFTLNIGKSDLIKSIYLNSEDHKVITIGNIDMVSHQHLLEFSQTGWWYEYFTGDSLYISETNRLILLEPGEYRLYSSLKIDNPFQIPLNKEGDQWKLVRIYPNPAGSFIILENAHLINGYEIYSTSGNKLIEYNNWLSNPQIEINTLPGGMYLLRYSTEWGSKTLKFVKTP